MDMVIMLDEVIEYVKFFQLQVQIFESNIFEDRLVIVLIDQIFFFQGNMVYGLK